MFRLKNMSLIIVFICVIFEVFGEEELFIDEICPESTNCVLKSLCETTNHDRRCDGNVNMICCASNETKLDLPDISECGKPSTADKVLGGNNTQLDEFPWMVVLEYRVPNTTTTYINCSGSLINHRYVLTAAHCLVKDGRRNTPRRDLFRVRLGEYHLTNATDCVNDVCADPIVNVTINIEDIFIHPNYTHGWSRKNDIGLIRLSNYYVNYTFFIAPICLPSTLELVPSSVDTFLEVSGWGANMTHKQSEIKQKLSVPVYDQDICDQKFNPKNNHYSRIIESQLCAGGIRKQDTCFGDSGAPIMAKSNKRYAIEGITSFGYKFCGSDDWPGVYTRVSSFEQWIKDIIRP